MSPVTIALVGAGSRGQKYAEWVAAHPDRARLVAVADPLPHRRERVGGTPYPRWEDLIVEGRVADAVIIATQDRDHLGPAEAFARAGYHVLLEKPLAPAADECRRIVATVEDAGVLLAVCHVLRYTPYTDLVKRVLDAGSIGELVSVEHLEPVGWWHFAHSYVRGNWRRADRSAPMLMTKSCHDLDWLAYVTGRRIERVSSFGGLRHFRPENAPPGAAERCLDCPAEPDCPYSAPKIYLPRFRDRGLRWPVNVITDGPDEAAVLTALRDGPYGRCVYRGDNDVADHQVVAMELSGGVTASFTVTAFTPLTHRQTRLFGTHGMLTGDGVRVRLHDFRTDTVTVLDSTGDAPATGDPTAGGGHGGGDAGVMNAFVTAVATGDPAHIRSGPAESLAAHLAVFAAEEARHTGRVVTVPVA
ncbi:MULTISPECIES: Gfo/Idh/MocA family protein [Catenuloplanes]|uniref:Dehydrogenase n=1 Tax=Catenuloplanes niger TaxID=587534 RepID=A0AAE3ZID4_9ACTN|nr:Gfo/Idh/MocA family oxidoreductase [Catenuloplanes niger]MDR7319771.1 putative dehydrogenase [Catenuloplanes niger]